MVFCFNAIHHDNDGGGGPTERNINSDQNPYSIVSGRSRDEKLMKVGWYPEVTQPGQCHESQSTASTSRCTGLVIV